MNRKIILSLILFMMLLPLMTAFTQNLQDNSDYRESQRYKQMSEEAMEAGEYEKALEYAEEAKEYAEKSEEYVQFMLAKYRANSALWKARNLLGQVERAGGRESAPAKIKSAQEMIEKADSLFKEESFEVSRATSRKAIELLNSIEIKTAQKKLPAAYVVRDMPGNEDCFWRIAGYDFVYDDPAGWWPIYQANKEKLPQPENPDLIRPGMVIQIPEREGENRSGVWVDGTIRDKAP
ncbi:MAG: hypothetical protein ACOC2R_03665 [Spirochaetota bacterium]